MAAKSPFGFFETRSAARSVSKSSSAAFPTERLHQLECKACPLNTAANRSPKMAPSGSDTPVVYLLGESPDVTDDETPDEELPKFGGHQVRHFLGKAGQRLRGEIPPEWRPHLRWNNIIRDRPQGNRTPTPVEVECCRPSIAKDIAESKPKAVLALGGPAAAWFGASGGINQWRGRRFPYALGGHSFWVYPVFHPLFVIRAEGAQQANRPGFKPPSGGRADESGWESRQSNAQAMPSWADRDKAALFGPDVEAFFSSLDTLPPPKVLTEADLLKQYRYFVGGGNEALAELRAALRALNPARVAIDIETKHLRPYAAGAKILTISFSDGERTVAVAVGHRGAKWTNMALLEQELLDYLYVPKVLVAHNAPFEAEWLTWLFFFADGENILFRRWDCTQAQAYVLDGDKGMLSLDTRMLLCFGLRIKELSDIDRKNLDDFNVEIVLRYNAIDAESTALLYDAQHAELKARKQLPTYRLQVSRIPSVILAQRRGVDVNQAEVTVQREDLGKQIIAKEKELGTLPEIRAYVQQHGPLNYNSPKQLVVLFKDMLGRTEGARGSSYSTDEAALSAMSKAGVASASILLDHRSLVKLKGTYLDPLVPGAKGGILYPDGKLHTSYNQTGTDTARLSSDDPNLQNFPKREHKEIRKVIVARAGHVLLACDYGQIEARVIAMLSQDAKFMKALWERYDIHKECGERLAAAYPALGRRLDNDAAEIRQEAKNKFVFPSFFNASEKSVAGYLQMPVEALRPVYRWFWKEYSGVKAWQDKLLADYKTKGYVESATGRRRYAPLSLSAVVNTPVQSTAADITMEAMARLAQRAHESGNEDILPVLQVHDDLTMHPLKQRLEAAMEEIVPLMLRSTFPWISVPLSVELSYGSNWGEMKKLATFHSDEL